MLNTTRKLPVLAHIAPSQAITLVDRIAELSPASQLRSLYESSVIRKGHAQGESVFDALVQYKDWISKDPSVATRCSNRQLLTRTTLVENMSKVLFAKFSIMEGVTFFGSAVRGKERPGNLNLMILTSPQDLDFKHNRYSPEEIAKTEVTKIEDFIKTNFPSIAGIKVNFFVNYTNQDPYLSNSICETGPYLVFVKGRSSREIYHFANTSCVDYLKNRDA